MKQNDAFADTREQLKEEKVKYKEKIKLIVNNWATIAAVAAVILSYIQYAYKLGICKVYHLPMNVITISLTDYMRSIIKLCGRTV